MADRLLATSDLHVNRPQNLAQLDALLPHPGDWLIVAGDVGDATRHLSMALERLTDRFERVLWAPGNHELWAGPGDPSVGLDRYEALVEVCRRHGVDTPEDPPPLYEGVGGPARVALCFVGYDFSFAPPGMSRQQARSWAAEDGIRAVDDRLLLTTPFPDVGAWCRQRVALTEARLAGITDAPIVLVNHYPLRRDLCRLPLAPRYAPWCGTTLTEDWHARFPIEVVVSGHLHVRATDWRDGVRFEEVSLGYPRQWRPEMGLERYLRTILPSPYPAVAVAAGPVVWR